MIKFILKTPDNSVYASEDPRYRWTKDYSQAITMEYEDALHKAKELVPLCNLDYIQIIQVIPNVKNTR